MAISVTYKSGLIIGLKMGVKSHLPHPLMTIPKVLEYGVCYEAMSIVKHP